MLFYVVLSLNRVMWPYCTGVPGITQEPGEQLKEEQANDMEDDDEVQSPCCMHSLCSHVWMAHVTMLVCVCVCMSVKVNDMEGDGEVLPQCQN
jgi:hypothetical protein